MAVTQCAKGHYFDDGKFTECPHCKENLPENPRRGFSDTQTMLGSSIPGIADLVPRRQVRIDMGAQGGARDERTVGIFQTEKGCDPVVGWLVCVGGRERGRDFRLHSGRNYIGRAIKNDVALVDDEQVSREDHCSVIFEPRAGSFHLIQGRGDGVLLNGERLLDNRLLSDGDAVTIGGSEFIFVPFCGEGRSW